MTAIGEIDPEALWQPQKPGRTSVDEYRLHVNKTFKQSLRTSQELHQWTVDYAQDFWIDLYRWLKFVPSLPKGIAAAYDDEAPMSSSPAFFPGLKFNYAENALFSNPNPDAVAVIGVREDTDWDQKGDEQLTWRQFRDQVRLTASALRKCGIKQGDRVAALVATSIWAMVLFHATASIGAIFTSISPDLGNEGCISRLQQVTPSILFADSATLYKGKTISTLTKIDDIIYKLSANLQVYIIPMTSGEQTQHKQINDFLAQADSAAPLTFHRVPFNHPLLICYSSGTTGAPKCIVHHHGLLLQFKKVAMVHNSTTPSDVILQYSSTSWIVFYIMSGYFACGATTILYNGSPTYPHRTSFLSLILRYKVTYLGTSPRYMLELQLAGIAPRDLYDLSSLRLVYSTGATLPPSQYRWFYNTAFPSHVHLANTAGGTDTATSLIAADPSSVLRAGEMQIAGLGMDVDVADPETGKSVKGTGRAGEMVVRKAFPSMPCCFWGDQGGKKYFEAYFERFAGVGMDVWAQHDWLRWNPKTGGWVMEGRSDGVLNPSGVRFGSGEIYAVVEAAPLTELISNSLCVGRRRPQDQDEDVFLFVIMRAGKSFGPEVVQVLKQAISRSLSPRHVPRYIFEVPDIPVTVNGKKVEAAVKQTISGRNIKPSNTVVNPQALEYFNRFRNVEREARVTKL